MLINTDATPDKTSLKVRSQMLKGNMVPIIVIMKEQSSFNVMSSENIVLSLKKQAIDSQTDINYLMDEEKAKGNANKIKQFWVINAISLQASPELIDRLAKRDDITSIELDSRVVAQWDYSAQISQSSIQNATLEIKRINAPEAWELGITGKGINISIIDSGINSSHPDIASRVIKWLDLVGFQPSPYDDFGHGTHVAGTIAGNGSGGTTTGVAPEANLFGVKALDGNGNGYETDIITGIQWSIENKADVISMSIGTTQTWTTPNCNADNYAMATATQNAIDAGIVVVAAAGNSASGVSSPGCIAGTIAVGAVDSSDTITYFSGRGSAMVDHGLVAPGYWINSLDYRTSGYTSKSGTSMATPHVSGTVADLLQAAKDKGLILSPGQVKNILDNTSVDLGITGKDNIYGAGRIDVFEAIRQYSNCTINGTVRDNFSGIGIANVIVSINANISTMTNEEGFYSFTALEGDYNIMAVSDPKYITNNTIAISTRGKMFVHKDIELLKKPTGNITGNIFG
ncbi:MAG: S8 family serine peptidase [Candidatus Methanoperedens sp.]|nr:S8 family serine peptidase [Candidatus Methanoperedens sp.]